MLEHIGGVILVLVLQVFFLVSRYKRCPSDKILVVYGKTGGDKVAAFYAGGAAFVWPVIQDYAYLDRTPLKLKLQVNDAPSKDGTPVAISGAFVVAIGDTNAMMEAAANRLLTLSRDQIVDLCKELIIGQLRLVVSALASVELNGRKQLIDTIYVGVNKQLKTIGLQLLNVDLDHVQFNKGNTVDQAQSTSTEEQNTQSSTVVLAIRPDQVDALLQGESINLPLPDGGRAVQLSVVPAKTN
ncbi:MAG: SPFH domain-containing protein [Lewinella sp.]